MPPVELGPQRVGATITVARDPDGGQVRRTVLPSGLRIVTETMPGVRSAAVGMWVDVGSRDERPSLAGASHYLEHLLFKATARRDALAIASEMDAVGGEMNAFTGKEHTCYYARVVDVDVPLAVDLLTDLVTGALLASADVEAERDVICEEIAMHDDEPGDAVHELLAATVHGDHPLGRPVIGTPESIRTISRRAIAGHYRRRYTPDRMVLAAAGNVDHRAIVRQVSRVFADYPEASPAPLRPSTGAVPFHARVRSERRHAEQAHLLIGTPGPHRTSDDRFTLAVLNAALGGGMSSRLFQQVRERRGLAYAVYSYATAYADTGHIGVYAGCAPRRARTTLEVIRDTVADVAAHGITAEELARGKGQVRGATVLGAEDPAARMSRIGKSDLAYGTLITVDEMLAVIDAVSLEEVCDMAQRLLAGPWSVSVIGPASTPDLAGVV